METTHERADHDAAFRNCDECGCLIAAGEQANPAEMAEAFCPVCWPTAEAADAAARAADAAPVCVSCKACGLQIDAGKAWGYLDDANPRWSCEHTEGRARECTCCSSLWHRLGMTSDFDEGHVLKQDCPDCEEWWATGTTYEGLKDYAGWKVRLFPEAENGSEGFTRVHISASDVNRAAAKAAGKDIPQSYNDWVEARWLTEWLKAGLIRAVQVGAPRRAVAP